MVPKKENDKGKKQYRLVIDYRELNKTIEPSSYPIPLIDEIIDQMHGSKEFTLDLCSAFHKIPLSEESKPYTAFSTCWDKYCFNSVLFGLVYSPYAWLKLIHTLLRDVIGRHVFVYVDAIIIFTTDFETHIQVIVLGLSALSTHHLKLNVTKSKFLQTQVKFLGFIITTDGLKPDPRKTKSIQKFPTPTNVKETQSFFELCNYYRRYVQDFAGRAKPLYNLCEKDTKFAWTSECENAFNQFKTILINPPVLMYPNEEQFILSTDASDRSIAGVIS